MRVLVTVGVVSACVLGAAIAQEMSTEPRVIAITWDEQPTARDFARLYPRPAQRTGTSGYGLLCCSVLEDRRLDCELAFEWPRDQGFGEATLEIGRKFRMSEASYAETRPTPENRIRRGIVWQMGERTPELQAVLTRIYEGTRNLCQPGIPQSAPNQGDTEVIGDAGG